MLVDQRTRDDAAVYRLDAKTALVQTVDFFTPVVDDPEAFCREIKDGLERRLLELLR